jgi:hypothetical protein
MASFINGLNEHFRTNYETHHIFFLQCLVYFVELTCNIYWLFLAFDGTLLSSDRKIFALNLFQITISFGSLVFSYQQCLAIVMLQIFIN